MKTDREYNDAVKSRDKRIKELRTALQIIKVWATVERQELDHLHVIAMCVRTLEETK